MSKVAFSRSQVNNLREPAPARRLETTLNAANHPDGLPKYALDQLPRGPFLVHWMQHAIAELDNEYFDFAWDFLDGFDPECLDLADPYMKVVEVTVRGYYCEVDKFVVRIGNKTEYDLVLVLLAPRNERESWAIKSCWSNHKNDHHVSLNPQRVALPPVRL